LGEKEGRELRAANNMGATDAVADSYRFEISPDITGFIEPDFFKAFLGGSFDVFLEKFYASDRYPDKSEGGHFLRQSCHLNSIKGDAERAADLTSVFMHGLGNLSASVSLKRWRSECAQAKQCVDILPDNVIARESCQDPHAAIGLEAHAPR
jgi:hypothetical protein